MLVGLFGCCRCLVACLKSSTSWPESLTNTAKIAMLCCFSNFAIAHHGKCD